MAEGEAQRLRDRLERTPDMLSVLAESATANPDKPAVVFLRRPDDPQPRELSYRDLLRQAEQVAGGLLAGGLRPDQAVALLSPATPEAVAVLIAAATVGVALPINPLLSPQAMAAQLRLANARAAFVAPQHAQLDQQERLMAALEEAPEVEWVVEAPLLAGAEPGEWAALRGDWTPATADRTTAVGPPDRPAALFHTGGTTGEPKLAELSARGLAAGALMSAAALQLRSDDRVLLGLPLFHVGGAITCVFSALSVGASVVFCSVAGARDPELIRGVWRVAADSQASVLAMVPTSLGTVVDVPVGQADLSRLRAVVTGSSPISPILVGRLEAKLGVPVCQVFGMTELSGICTAQPMDGRSRSPAVGYPAPLLELSVQRDDPADPVGEVVIGGPNLFLGYRTTAGRQDEPHGGTVRSGDLGQIAEDGQVRLVGRSKDVIIRGGHNIDPLMIEDAAYAFPGIAQAAAVAMPDAYAGELPALYVSLRPGADFVLAGFEAHLSAQIADRPARPKTITVLEALPLTPVGKIARFRLRQAAAERVAREILADLPQAGMSCTDVAAKAIAVTWRPEATDADRSAAAERLAAYGLRPI